MDNTFDIEFVIPISLKDKYFKRINDFRKYGLLNIANRQVLVSLLCEDYNEDILQGWPTGVNARFIACPYAHQAAKVYYYYANYDIDLLKRVRWHAKIDDDSFTDVNNLLHRLDDYGDYRKHFYFAAATMHNIEPEEMEVCSQLGFQKWFTHTSGVDHEIEGSFLSQAAMLDIQDNPTAMQLIRKRAELRSGFTDIALACAARICKIYPQETNFMSQNPEIGRFTVLGGDKCHIHYIAHDVNSHAWEFLTKCLDKPIDSELSHKQFGLFQVDELILNYVCAVELLPIRTLHVWSHREHLSHELKLWDVMSDDEVKFFNDQGQCLIIFDTFSNGLFYGTGVGHFNLHAKYVMQPLPAVQPANQVKVRFI